VSEIIGVNQAKVALRIECHRGHQWNSEITGVCWDGPIFATSFCPQCGLLGKRIPFTADDVDNYISEDDVRKIGEDAMPVYAYLYSELIQIPAQESKSMTFTLEHIYRHVLDSPGRVLQRLERLRALKYLDIDEIPKSHSKFCVEYFTDPAERRFRVAFGDQSHLVRLTDGIY
jgi:hypothetical protein